MEFSLERRVDGAAIVSKTVLGGVAHRNGVSVGSCVIGVGGNRGGSFNEMVATMGGGKRPIEVMFRRPFAGMGGGGSGGMVKRR